MELLDKKILEEIGDNIVTDVREYLIRKGKDATGELIRSLSYDVTYKANEWTLEILYAEHGVYVDKGRKPGSFPPVNAIKAWCRTRGINQNAAFPIAKNIAKFGIKPTNFSVIIDKGFKEADSILEEELFDKLKTYFDLIGE